jgi:hypothetical protein
MEAGLHRARPPYRSLRWARRRFSSNAPIANDKANPTATPIGMFFISTPITIPNAKPMGLK